MRSFQLSPPIFPESNYSQIFLTDLMPKTATGKVQRRMVAEAMLIQQKPKAKL